MLAPESENPDRQFESHGVQLTYFSLFGQDLLHEKEDLIKLQEEEFYEHFQTSVLFS